MFFNYEIYSDKKKDFNTFDKIAVIFNNEIYSFTMFNTRLKV